MNDRNPLIVLSILIIIIAAVGTISGWAMIQYLENTNSNDNSFSISGTYLSDDTEIPCSGSATYSNLQESQISYVYQFIYAVSYEDEYGITQNISEKSTLIVSCETHEPDRTLYVFLGNNIIDGITVSMWSLSESNNEFIYYINDGNILRIDIDDGPLTAVATINDN